MMTSSPLPLQFNLHWVKPTKTLVHIRYDDQHFQSARY